MHWKWSSPAATSNHLSGKSGHLQIPLGKETSTNTTIELRGTLSTLPNPPFYDRSRPPCFCNAPPWPPLAALPSRPSSDALSRPPLSAVSFVPRLPGWGPASYHPSSPHARSGPGFVPNAIGLSTWRDMINHENPSTLTFIRSRRFRQQGHRGPRPEAVWYATPSRRPLLLPLSPPDSCLEIPNWVIKNPNMCLERHNGQTIYIQRERETERERED